MAKTPETTIDTLDMGSLCLLTLTTRHIRGNVTKLMPNGAKQQDQIDVLLSGLAGYTVTEISRKLLRIQGYVWGVGIAILGLYGFSFSWVVGLIGLAVGALVVYVSSKFKDVALFELNVMGSKTAIPIRQKDVGRVREFIAKIQNAKIAYEEDQV